MYVQEKGIRVNEPVRNASEWSSNENPIGLAGADLASAVWRDLGRNLSHTKTANFPSTLTFLGKSPVEVSQHSPEARAAGPFIQISQDFPVWWKMTSGQDTRFVKTSQHGLVLMFAQRALFP